MRILPTMASAGLAFAAAALVVPAAAVAQQGGTAPNWTGLYAGVHAGVGAGSIRGGSATGGLIGGQAGFNTQADRVVLGIEGDVTSSGFEHKAMPSIRSCLTARSV
jgi:opacity protein-like surface antigen